MTISPKFKILFYILIAVGALAVITHHASRYPETAICQFRQYTGFLCPGCGAQRSLQAFFRLDWVQSVRFNLLVPVSMAVLGSISVLLLINFQSTWNRVLNITFQPVFRWSILILVLSYWFLRNL